MRPEQEEAEAGLEDVIRPGTTRGLDFVIIDELRKRTGITPDSILKFTLGETLCNSLDTSATKIDIDVRNDGKFHRLKISDNGSKKLTIQEIKLILNFDYKASSKRGFHRISRGYLGNALKCAIGYSYALAESKGLTPPDIVVKSAGAEYRIALKPNRVKGVIESEIVTAERNDDGCTTFIVKFPGGDLSDKETSELKDLIFASSMVNPARKISYNIFGEKGALGSAEGNKAIRRETSVLWYTQKQFQSLFEDFLRAKPETRLRDFISLFRGFTSKKVIGEILQNLGSGNHDSRKNPRVQFFPATPIQELSTGAVSELFSLMRAKAKPIANRSIGSVLGFVGEESFEKIRKQYGWERLRYTKIPSTQIECPIPLSFHDDSPCDNSDHVEFPCLVELAIFDRKADGEGLKVYQCVNFMASMEDIFSRIFRIGYRLGRVGIEAETPVTVVAHLVCPVLKWLNYGKSGLDE